jgi:hypothetical protein
MWQRISIHCIHYEAFSIDPEFIKHQSLFSKIDDRISWNESELTQFLEAVSEALLLENRQVALRVPALDIKKVALDENHYKCPRFKLCQSY